MSLSRIAFLFVAALATLTAGQATAQPKGPPPTLDKAGWIDDPKLQRFAPPAMAVVSEKALKDLYKAWKIAGEPPAIDFNREFVIVMTAKGDAVFFVAAMKGNVQVELTGPPKDKPGFAYHLATHPRDGIKSVNNKPLPKS